MIVYCIILYVILEEFIYFMQSVIIELTVLFDIAFVKVVQSTWTQRGFRCRDPTVYKGLSGTAFMCFRSYQITGNKEDLALCSEIIYSCAAVARSLRQ